MPARASICMCLRDPPMTSQSKKGSMQTTQADYTGEYGRRGFPTLSSPAPAHSGEATP